MVDPADITAALTSEVEELRSRLAEADAKMAAQTAQIAAQAAQLEKLTAQVLELLKDIGKSRRGTTVPSSERRPSLASPQRTPEQRAEAEQRRVQTRKHNSKAKLEAVPKRDIPVPAGDTCPKCGSVDHVRGLAAEVSEVFELVRANLERVRYLREKKVCCGCGGHWEAPAPDRVFGTSMYGPNLVAEIVVSKAEDAMPINRQSTRFARAGAAISRQTATDLFHNAAAELRPIHDRLVALVAQAPFVQADETSQPMRAAKACVRAYIWTFISSNIVAFVFATSRSGAIAAQTLGDSQGALLCDGHTGYNRVTDPTRRTRHGCSSHARSKYVLALVSDPERATRALELFGPIFLAEKLARERGVLGTDEHRRLRDEHARPAFEELRKWVDAERPKVLPKSPMGEAFRYTVNQWSRLTAYLPHLDIPPHNNTSERELRVVARGRDTYRWVGSEQAGKNLAILLTIVQTCRRVHVDPGAYIADVLMRVATTPASALDTLLPWEWAKAREQAATDAA